MRTQKKIENEAHVSMKPTQADRTYSNKNAGCSLFELSRPAAYRHIAYVFPSKHAITERLKKAVHGLRGLKVECEMYWRSIDWMRRKMILAVKFGI